MNKLKITEIGRQIDHEQIENMFKKLIMVILTLKAIPRLIKKNKKQVFNQKIKPKITIRNSCVNLKNKSAACYNKCHHAFQMSQSTKIFNFVCRERASQKFTVTTRQIKPSIA